MNNEYVKYTTSGIGISEIYIINQKDVIFVIPSWDDTRCYISDPSKTNSFDSICYILNLIKTAYTYPLIINMDGFNQDLMFEEDYGLRYQCSNHIIYNYDKNITVNQINEFDINDQIILEINNSHLPDDYLIFDNNNAIRVLIKKGVTRTINHTKEHLISDALNDRIEYLISMHRG